MNVPSRDITSWLKAGRSPLILKTKSNARFLMLFHNVSSFKGEIYITQDKTPETSMVNLSSKKKREFYSFHQ